MAIKAFHRIGLAKESRGSSLMKSCHTNEEVKHFRKDLGIFQMQTQPHGPLGALRYKYDRDLFLGTGEFYPLKKRLPCTFGNILARVLSAHSPACDPVAPPCRKTWSLDAQHLGQQCQSQWYFLWNSFADPCPKAEWFTVQAKVLGSAPGSVNMWSRVEKCAQTGARISAPFAISTLV